MRLVFLQKGPQRALLPEDMMRGWQSAILKKALTRTSEPDHVGDLILGVSSLQKWEKEKFVI